MHIFAGKAAAGSQVTPAFEWTSILPAQQQTYHTTLTYDGYEMADKFYRNIRPSFGESSRSGQNLQEENEEGGRSSPEPRRKMSTGPKHRKVPESVTRNACLNCKKARAKCDGKTPCKRCWTRGEESDCVYEIHLKHAKEDLVKQIKELQAKDALSQQIFQTLSIGVNVPEVLQMLSNGDSPESIVKNIGKLTLNDNPPSGNTSPAASFAELEQAPKSPATELGVWTKVTSDKSVLDHLFQLYFSWVHPVHTIFSEGQFVQSYHNGSHGESSHCSSVLVNAVCAMACHLHLSLEIDTLNFQDLSIKFSDAVRDELSVDDSGLTMIQAFAIMFLVESTRGNGLLATSYLNIAAEGLSRVDPQIRFSAPDVWTSTVLGIQGLNVEWSQIICRVPTNINMSVIQANPTNNGRLDRTRWHIYSTPSDMVPSRPSLQATTTREKCKLIAIIYDVSTVLYSDRAPSISARTIFDLYTRLAQWRANLSAALVHVEAVNDGHGLPHILSLLVLYSTTLLQLLQPTLKSDGLSIPLVENIIWTNAQEGFDILSNRYRSQFPLRCQSVTQMYSLLHFADAIARFFPGGTDQYLIDGPQAIKNGIEMLDESVQNAPVAAVMQEMLRKTAASCLIRVSAIEPMRGTGQYGKRKKYGMDEFIKACTRPTFNQSLGEIASRFAPSFSEDWIALHNTDAPAATSLQGADFSSAQAGPGTHGSMQIRNLLN